MKMEHCVAVVCFLFLVCDQIVVSERVLLSSSGPASLESQMTFTASCLVHSSSSSSFSSSSSAALAPLYYRWASNKTSHFPATWTNGSDHVELWHTFSACHHVHVGRYVMDVDVYAAHGSKVASASVLYELTDYIHGSLIVHQETPASLPADVFVTNQILSVAFLLREVFSDAQFNCTWRLSETYAGSCANQTTRFTTAGSYTIGVNVVVHPRAGCYKPVGYSQKQIQLKDAITAINYTGNTSVAVNSALRINMSCNGSGPFLISWTISNSTSAVVYLRSNRCELSISEVLNTSGHMILTLMASNVVSNASRQIKINVYKPADDRGAVAIYIPIICVLAGLVSVFCIAYAYYIDQHRSLVETADFDYRRHRRPSGSRLDVSAVVAKLYRRLFRVAGQRNDRRRGSESKQQNGCNRYGAVM